MRNLRLMSICLMFGLPIVATAQVNDSPALADGSKSVESKADDVVTITIRPASEPDPAIRYRFWPAPQNRKQKNAMPFVSRAVLMSVQSNQNARTRELYREKQPEWSEMPLDELPVAEVRDFLELVGNSALNELARAENYMKTDYDVGFDELSAGGMFRLLLPELQEMRNLGRLISLRIRLAAAEGRWDDFQRDCRIGFRLAEVAAKNCDFLVGRLVGFAVSGIILQDIQDAIQQPGCPSFYWALASLPAERLFETRESIEFESVFLSRLLDGGSFPDELIGAEAARSRIRSLAMESALLMGDTGNDNKASFQLAAGLYVAMMADASRESLEETEQWKGRTESMSAPEAVLRSMNLEYIRLRDTWVKWSLLPPELVVDYQAEIRDAVAEPSPTNIVQVLHWQLSPAVDAARHAGLRSRQQRNFLLTIEALRMHADMSGELPRSLEKLRPVPAWHDSIAMKPFQYTRVSRNEATLIRSTRYEGDKDTTVRFRLEK